jgi:branched-chain amino acid transport system permease protein
MSEGAVPESQVRPAFLFAGPQAGRMLVRALIALVIVFVVVWVLALADNAAASQPRLFFQILLNALTLAGLYFVVASGFTLIFGLMRVVNMAHGSFYLLGGYIALKVAETWGNWGLGLLIAALGVGAVGLLTQQAFLRWNQGQELRQALITIAISVILADQMLGAFGGVPQDFEWPSVLQKIVDLAIFDLTYSFTRIFVLICAIAVGVLLWLWLQKTRMGMIIRAGVDDRQMVSALGVNIQLAFAVAFFVGSALAALGGVLGGSQLQVIPGADTDFLVNSLVVVIIGGMGSLGGAAVGALLFGVVDIFSDIYLPCPNPDDCWSNYSVLLTFILLVAVLAVRPYGLFGRRA